MSKAEVNTPMKLEELLLQITPKNPEKADFEVNLGQVFVSVDFFFSLALWLYFHFFYLDPNQTQMFFTLRTVFTNIKQMFMEDSYAVFNVCKHL